MSDRIVFRAVEATVFAKEGQFTDAMPEILIGETDGPVGQAFAQMMQIAQPLQRARMTQRTKMDWRHQHDQPHPV